MEHTKDKQRLRSLDFFMGLLFAGIGAYVAIEGLRALGDSYLATVPKATNPGSTTLVIGSLLALAGGTISVIGLLGSGNPFARAREALPGIVTSLAFKKGFLVLAEVAAYFFLLWNNLPFLVSTPLFLASLMATFKAGAWWKILIVAALTTALAYYIFAILAVVPLPSEFFWQRLSRAGK
jgi:hypothetical protein